MDLANSRSKHVGDMNLETFDCVITLSERAKNKLPPIPGATRLIHEGFEAPSKSSSKATRSCDWDAYRRVRDEIRLFVESLFIPSL